MAPGACWWNGTSPDLNDESIIPQEQPGDLVCTEALYRALLPLDETSMPVKFPWLRRLRLQAAHWWQPDDADYTYFLKHSNDAWRPSDTNPFTRVDQPRPAVSARVTASTKASSHSPSSSVVKKTSDARTSANVPVHRDPSDPFVMSEFQLVLADTLGSCWKFIGGMAVMRGEDNRSQLLFMRNVVERPNGLQGADCEEVQVLMEMVEEDLAFGGASVDKSIDPHYWLISTPNYSVIFEPLLGDRRVRARLDGHFGPDDRSMWPQLFIEGNEWVACIPHPVTDKANPAYWLSRPLTLADTTVTDLGRVVSSASPFRLIHSDVLDHLKKCHHAVFSKIQEIQLHWDNSVLPQRYRTQLAHFVLTLQSAMEFINNKILDIHGLLYWATRVVTEVNSLTEKFETGVRPTNHGLMGCFTFNEQIANAMHRYGIPVWYIRPDWTMTPTTFIQRSGEGSMVTCSSTLETRAFVNDHDEDDPYPVVYDGPAGTFDSIRAMKSGGAQGWQGVSRLMSGPLIRHPQGHLPPPSGKSRDWRQREPFQGLPQGDFSVLHLPNCPAAREGGAIIAVPRRDAPPPPRFSTPLPQGDLPFINPPVVATILQPPRPPQAAYQGGDLSDDQLRGWKLLLNDYAQQLAFGDNEGHIHLKHQREHLTAAEMCAHPEHYHKVMKGIPLIERQHRTEVRARALKEEAIAEYREQNRAGRQLHAEVEAKVQGMKEYRHRYYHPDQLPQLWDARFDNSKSRGLSGVVAETYNYQVMHCPPERYTQPGAAPPPPPPRQHRKGLTDAKFERGLAQRFIREYHANHPESVSSSSAQSLSGEQRMEIDLWQDEGDLYADDELPVMFLPPSVSSSHTPLLDLQGLMSPLTPLPSSRGTSLAPSIREHSPFTGTPPPSSSSEASLRTVTPRPRSPVQAVSMTAGPSSLHNMSPSTSSTFSNLGDPLPERSGSVDRDQSAVKTKNQRKRERKKRSKALHEEALTNAALKCKQDDEPVEAPRKVTRSDTLKAATSARAGNICWEKVHFTDYPPAGRQFPRIDDVWRDALVNVDQDRSLLNVEPPFILDWFFPSPYYLATAGANSANPKKFEEVWLNWLSMADAWCSAASSLAMVSASEDTQAALLPPALPSASSLSSSKEGQMPLHAGVKTYAWRTLLDGVLEKTSRTPGAGVVSSTNPKVVEMRKQAKAWFGESASIEGVPAEWSRRGTRYLTADLSRDGLPDTLVVEELFLVIEMNWQHELMALDRALAPKAWHREGVSDATNDICVSRREVELNRVHDPLTVYSMNAGMVLTQLPSQHPAVAIWKTYKIRLSSLSVPTAAFFNEFHRAPIVPCCLPEWALRPASSEAVKLSSSSTSDEKAEDMDVDAVDEGTPGAENISSEKIVEEDMEVDESGANAEWIPYPPGQLFPPINDVWMSGLRAVSDWVPPPQDGTPTTVRGISTMWPHPWWFARVTEDDDKVLARKIWMHWLIMADDWFAAMVACIDRTMHDFHDNFYADMDRLDRHLVHRSLLASIVFEHMWMALDEHLTQDGARCLCEMVTTMNRVQVRVDMDELLDPEIVEVVMLQARVEGLALIGKESSKELPARWTRRGHEFCTADVLRDGFPDGFLQDELWLLNENTFRFEFLALDHHLAAWCWTATDVEVVTRRNWAKERESKLTLMFLVDLPHPSEPFFPVVQVPASNPGLVSYDDNLVRSRLSLAMMAYLISSWTYDSVSSSLASVAAWDSLSLGELMDHKKVLVEKYCMHFFEVFHRPPVVPCLAVPVADADRDPSHLAPPVCQVFPAVDFTPFEDLRTQRERELWDSWKDVDCPPEE
ncbi:hypothetical protein FISHEDRAFT_69166 [Fistulina hepatica ATCC 64428]|uniref:Uncharacterized protein n=1 Tax=Fistulina hepatica ATCC 64428 TaxID=1128425 RepID=A0A0D7ANJ6_9AGAR|nr:hypothetical protein FISHEDRAFT_69166 [Fistulina hepatica ATCC 64428]